jgi:anti-anti-sigma factor
LPSPRVNEIEISHAGSDVVIVRLYGDHDLGTRAALAELLEQLMHADKRVIVDLSEVGYVDSSMLHNLVHTDALARERGRRLTLQVGTAAIFAKVLEITGLRDHLLCADSRQEAIRIARSSG